MFEQVTTSTVEAPDLAVNDHLPDAWPVLATPVDSPGPGVRIEAKRRHALVALHDGTWHPAVVWHWSWTPTDTRPVWTAHVEFRGRVAWYLWRDDQIRLDPLRRGRHTGW